MRDFNFKKCDYKLEVHLAVTKYLWKSKCGSQDGTLILVLVN